MKGTDGPHHGSKYETQSARVVDWQYIHSLTQKKAKEKRTVVQTPDQDSYAFRPSSRGQNVPLAERERK
jgi:hypothetical protein